MKIVEYLDQAGRSPFAKWFDALDARAAAKISSSLARISVGNLSSVKSVGDGVVESRIDWGPGYRIYFGREGEELVILLAGGTKRRQDKDIAVAKSHWQDYRSRRKET